MSDFDDLPLPPAPLPHRCTRCGYVIDHLGIVGRCPECGLTYDMNDPFTYTTKPPFVWWTFWLPGLIASFISGMILYAVFIPMAGFGWSTAVVVPTVAGVTLGYRTRASGVIAKVFLAIVLIAAFAFTLMSLNLVGAFCALVLGVIAFGPILLGMAIGVCLRWWLKQSAFSQRMHLPILLGLACIAAAVEGRHDHLAVVSTRTSLTITASPEQTWDAIQFYEEVKHPPPLLLRITPTFRPVRTKGSSQSVGDIKVCFYERGRLTKQVTEIIHGQRLAFRVMEQTDIQNRGVRLIDGSFDLTPTADGKGTVVTLTTRYQPNLAPRFAFLPAENLAVHTLHGHVLEGMKLKAEGN